MAITIKRTTLWRKEVPDRSGVWPRSSTPGSRQGRPSGRDGVRHPGPAVPAAIEVAPISGKKAARAAGAAGLTPSNDPRVLVVGDNKPGLGHAIAAAMGSSGVNLASWWPR